MIAAEGADFLYIEPPFNFNADDVRKYPVEVSGNYLMKCMARRLEWRGLTGRRLLDFGCGVRFARTIANLDIDIANYCGLDLNVEAITWLQANLPAPRFQFGLINAHHVMYRPDGLGSISDQKDMPFAGEHFDAACMFSVITHQQPEEAKAILTLLRRSFTIDRLYFTAFVDDGIQEYSEKAPDSPRLVSAYNSGALKVLVEGCGWHIDTKHEPSLFQQSAFVCSPV